MVMEDVAITGMGLVSPIGLNVPEAEASLRNAASGIRLYEAPPIRKPFAAGAIPVQFEEEFPRLERPFLDRVQQMAILAARQAIGQAGLEEFSGYGERAGLYYGNVNGGTATGLEWFQQLLLEGRQRSRPWTSMAIMGNGGGAQIAIRHRITGPVITSSSACASSGVSIGEAARAIARGDLDIAVAGGAEGSLTSLVLGTFDGTRAMSEPDPDDPSNSCRPSPGSAPDWCGRRSGFRVRKTPGSRASAAPRSWVTSAATPAPTTPTTIGMRFARPVAALRRRSHRPGSSGRHRVRMPIPPPPVAATRSRRIHREVFCAVPATPSSRPPSQSRPSSSVRPARWSSRSPCWRCGSASRRPARFSANRTRPAPSTMSARRLAPWRSRMRCPSPAVSAVPMPPS